MPRIDRLHPNEREDVIPIMKDIAVKEYLLAIVTSKRDAVGGGGTPIFYAKDEEEQARLALYLARIVDGMVHDLGNGVYIIVKH